MRILQIIAHPAQTSFTLELAEAFRTGAKKSGHTVIYYNVYDEDAPGVEEVKDLVLSVNHLSFAFPNWWEMPPAKLVELLQTVFVKGFAFDLDIDRMKPLIQLPTSVLISMGQQKEFNTTNLHDAMKYCGLHPTFHVFNNVGPRLTPDNAKAYIDLAFSCGRNL